MDSESRADAYSLLAHPHFELLHTEMLNNSKKKWVVKPYIKSALLELDPEHASVINTKLYEEEYKSMGGKHYLS